MRSKGPNTFFEVCLGDMALERVKMAIATSLKKKVGGVQSCVLATSQMKCRTNLRRTELIERVETTSFFAHFEGKK